MGSLERKLRVREITKESILKAAMKIVKNDGWQSLSMRKIAEVIEYTVPVIYEYFINKDALLSELTKRGFQRLGLAVRKARNLDLIPEKQLQEMWKAYWDFAFKEKEYYQLMFGVGTQCSLHKAEIADNENHAKLFMEVIKEMLGEKDSSSDLVKGHYMSLWSIVHGLVAINMVSQGSTKEINNKILIDVLESITMVRT